MKLSNVVVMCLSALLGLLMVCFTAIACTMVVNWSVSEEVAILEGKVCSVQVFNSDYAVEPLADTVDYYVDGVPNEDDPVGVWRFSSSIHYGNYYKRRFYPCVFTLAGVSDSSVFYGIYTDVSDYPTYSTIGFVFEDSITSVSQVSSSNTIFVYDGSLSEAWLDSSYQFISVSSYSFSSSISFPASVKLSDSPLFNPFFPPGPDNPPVQKGSYIAPFLDVFDGVGVWLITGLNNVIALFWVVDTGTLTLLGVLAVAALAVSVFFLLMSIIQNFLHFRG